jgi:hypothetical protein
VIRCFGLFGVWVWLVSVLELVSILGFLFLILGIGIGFGLSSDLAQVPPCASPDVQGSKVRVWAVPGKKDQCEYALENGIKILHYYEVARSEWFLCLLL